MSKVFPAYKSAYKIPIFSEPNKTSIFRNSPENLLIKVHIFVELVFYEINEWVGMLFVHSL